MRFGRGRVQDRTRDSDEQGVTEPQSATPGAADTPDASADDAASPAGAAQLPSADRPSAHSGWVDENVLPRVETDARATGDMPSAIEELRAATTSTDATPTLDDIAQIRRLHDMRIEAEGRSHHAFLKPSARRKFQYALTAETAALRMLGFGSYEAFDAVYGSAPSAPDAAAPSGALLRRRPGYILYAQHLDAVAVAVALDARLTRVDHVMDARHGERGLGDVGREHHAALAARVEHPVLLRVRQARVERQDLGPDAMLAQRFGRLADLALAGQEHEHVSRPLAAGLLYRARERRLLLVARGVLRVAGHGPPADFNRVQAARHLDHRRAAEVPGELFRVDRCGGHDQFQIFSLA